MAECGKSTSVNLPLIHAGRADYADVCACPELYSNFNKNRYRFGVRTDRRAALLPALPRPPWHISTTGLASAPVVDRAADPWKFESRG